MIGSERRDQGEGGKENKGRKWREVKKIEIQRIKEEGVKGEDGILRGVGMPVRK